MQKASLILLFILVAVDLSAQAEDGVLVTGYVTDTLCGRAGANAQHAEHARNAVASGKARYAIYDEATKRLYILESQATAAQYAGQYVTVTGTLASAPIRHAGQSFAPDAPAAYLLPSDPARATAASAPARIQQHAKALDTSTAVAGILRISSIAAAPDPPPLDDPGRTGEADSLALIQSNLHPLRPAVVPFVGPMQAESAPRPEKLR